MKLLLLFLLTTLMAGLGSAMGAMLGNNLGRGGVLLGGFAVGALMTVGAVFLASRWGWITRRERFWSLIGATAGLVLAAVVTLSTLSTPLGPMVSTVLVGLGAVLGSLMDRSAHRTPSAT